MTQDPYTDGAFRDEICAWLRANGIDPDTVPFDCAASVADGTLTLRVMVRRDGRPVLDPTGSGVVTETITTPVLVDPSPAIAAWLRPRCQACGR